MYDTSNLRSARVRVGDPGSPIEPGDISPGGGVYRAGQFAPTIDELSTLSLLQADEAGLLNKNLPIFEDGIVDESKLEAWDPNGEIRGLHFGSSVPKYSAAVIIDALQSMGNLLSAMGLKYITAGTREEQEEITLAGEVIIASEFSAKNRKFEGRLKVFPSFYKYVSVPLVGMIQDRTSGLSIAHYAVLHSLGHLLFSRLAFDGRLEAMGRYLNSSGWTKYAGDDTHNGSFLSMENKSSWKRSFSYTPQTEASRYSPADDFSEAFALYFTNNEYLELKSTEKYGAIKAALEEYGYVL